MLQNHKTSSSIVIALLFLLPLFFLPLSSMSLEASKIALLTAGVFAAVIGFVLESARRGGFRLPSHFLMWATILIPAVYLSSALLSALPSRSLYGYHLEVGTFGFMLIVSALFGLAAIVFSDFSKIMRALAAFLVASAMLIIFALVKIFSGLLAGASWPVWGTFFGNMSNPVGSWLDYAVSFGLIAVFSALALGLLSVNKFARFFLLAVFSASTFLLVVVNFSSAFQLTLLASIVMLVYLLTIERRVSGETEAGRKTALWPAVVLSAVSLIFVINPTLSATYGPLGNAFSDRFGIANIDVRPSYSATLDVAKTVLEESPLFGAGPNTFQESWLLHKPQELNETVFWNTTFPSGMGFVPTQVVLVGAVGSLVWLAFFLLLVMLGYRALVRIPQERWERFVLVSTLLSALFLWGASFVYTPSAVIVSLAFIFTGLFVGGSSAAGIISTREIIFARSAALNFVSVLIIIALGVGGLVFGLAVSQRIVSTFHFQKALVMANTSDTSADAVESRLLKAIGLVPQDIYYSALSELSLARAEAAINNTAGTPQDNFALFEQAISKSISAAQAAVGANPASYRNWIKLGSIYEALVPEPFSVEGAFESAEFAFSEARSRNPKSPEVPLLLARLELSRGNTAVARAHIEEAKTLKPDYVDAYFLLTQLEIRENNLTEAIRSAETSVVLLPNNAGAFFQLGLLKYSDGDWSGTAAALEQALRILPEYANAKYFLGLALSRLGRLEEAKQWFRELVKTNPDNEEVRLILGNLEAGRDPLFQIPPTVSDVETRPTPPITENER